MSALTDKRERFCLEYLVDSCATKAAIRAGYSEKSAKQTGHELMSLCEVQERVAELQRERAERLRTTADDVLREVMIVGLSNVDDYEIDDAGHVSLREGVPEHMMRAVSSVKRRVRVAKDGSKTIETEIRLWDKPAALRMAGQHHGIFVEKHEHEHKGAVRFLPPTAPPPTDEAQERPDA